MNESEQAQAIAEIRAAHDLDMHFVGNLEDTVILQLLCHRKDLLEIVDSQAQKIAQLTKERDAMTATVYKLVVEQQQHIVEARKIAEKMRDAIERAGGRHTFLPREKR